MRYVEAVASLAHLLGLLLLQGQLQLHGHLHQGGLQLWESWLLPAPQSLVSRGQLFHVLLRKLHLHKLLHLHGHLQVLPYFLGQLWL